MNIILLEQPNKKHLFNVTDYYRMGEIGVLPTTLRTELIAGEILEIPPIGATHADWVDCLVKFWMKSVSDAIRVRAQNPLRLNEFNEPQPDILLLHERNYRRAHPTPEDVLLLIEVSDSSLRYDRETKVPLYAQNNVVETWIIDIHKQRLEIYRDPQAGEYQHILKSDWHQAVAAQLLPEVEINLAMLMP